MLSEENKKSEPFSYREKVRIFIVWCNREDSNLWPSGSESYDRAVWNDDKALILLTLHSCARNKKNPVVGYHNRIFRHFTVPPRNSGQMVVNCEWAETWGAKEIENLDRANTLFGNHFVK